MLVRWLGAAASVALLMLAAPAASEPATPAVTLPPSAQEAAATVDAFHAALRRGDTASASALLSDDALVFEEGRAERSKAEYELRHLAADAAFSKTVPAAVTRRRGHASGDFAWIATEGQAKGRFRGQSINKVTDETMVLRRIEGEWRIVHIHWSSAESAVE